MADKRGVSATSRNELTPELVGGLFRCQKTLDGFLQEPSTAVCFNDRQPGRNPTLVLRFDHFRCDDASFYVISGSTLEKKRKLFDLAEDLDASNRPLDDPSTFAALPLLWPQFK
jgi:hypothetical protein